MRRLMALFLLLAVPVLYLGWRYTDSGAAPLDSQGWRDRFLVCSPDRDNMRSLLTEATQLCLLDVMKDSVDADRLFEMQDGLGLAIVDAPGLATVCHTPGHRAGRYAFEKQQDIAAMILGNRSAVCAYAIGHGILDGFADTRPDDTLFRAATTACESIDMSGRSKEDTAQVLGLCADGIGHAAWSSTRDPVAAALRCGFLTVEINQSACGEGVIMQIYEPAGSEPTGEVAKAATELPSFCENWPGNATTRLGCYSGAGYIYSRPAWAFAYGKTTSLTEPFSGSDRTKLRALVLDAVLHCRAHPTPEGVSRCLWSLAQQTPAVVYLDRSLVDEVCVEYGEWAEKCRTFRPVVD